MAVTITNAAPADAAGVLAHLATVGGETDNLTFGGEGLPFSVEEEAKYIEGFCNSRDKIMLLAKDGDLVVADASLERRPYRMFHRAELGISVLRDYWGQGIATRLMERLIAFAKENGIEIIDLEVRSDNVRAIRLYERFGFRKIGTYPRFFKIGDSYCDFDMMCLSFV